MGLSFTTNWAHSVLAINRFVAAIFPHAYRYFTKKCLLCLGVAFLWVTAIVLNIYPVAELNGQRYAQSRPWGGCLPVKSASVGPTVLTALGIYVPCLMVGVS